MAITLTQIPGIMKANGWFQGAALLERWFNGPPNSNPKSGTPDTTTIQLSWVLGFPRAQAVYQGMVNDKIWVNEKARPKIVGLLQTLRKKQDVPVDFGNFTFPVTTVDINHIQYRAGGDMLRDPIDGLFTALGRFNLRMSIAGSVVPTGAGAAARHEVQIKKVAVYVWDSFDFNGDQPLGCWDAATNYGGRNPSLGPW
jgi:hypothetical protein